LKGRDAVTTNGATPTGARHLVHAVPLTLAALLAACATTPSEDRDGPPQKVPAGLANIRDAEPKVETIRIGGPNSPYRVLGRDYVPVTRDVAFRQKGLASWYGRKFHGRPTASGDAYDMFAMTAAHPTLPIPSYARISNPANGRSVVVRINDRGPFHDGRIVDLSYITFSEIRSGSWRSTSSAPQGLHASAGHEQALLVAEGLHRHFGDPLRRGYAGP
jgi:rare lipoprotein A